MRVVPSGWWNNVDWAITANGISMQGQLTNPNNSEGVNCMSFKDNTLRYMSNGISNDRVTNVVEYHNRVKYRTGDAWKVYSSHRTVIANSFSSDASFIKEHQDIVQYAMSAGPADAIFFGNVAVNNEGHTHTDVNDQFTNYTQPIGSTDQTYSGTYMCCNIIFNSANPMNIQGTFNVLVNNDVFMDGNGSGQTSVRSGSKVNGNLAAFSLMANNLANAIFRNNLVPGVTTDCTVDHNTVLNNVSISRISWSTGAPSANSNTYCNNSNQVVNNTLAVTTPDLTAWVPAAWTNNAGGNPLFTDANPLPPATMPAPGAGIMSTNFCLRNEFKVGTCLPGAPGRLDLRPNAAFVSTSKTGITAQLTSANNLPTTGTIGSKYLAGSAALCSNPAFCTSGVTYAAGFYTRVNSGTTITAYSPQGGLFNPGIIGQGVNLGIQGPPATHGRLPWTNPPNVGAY